MYGLPLNLDGVAAAGRTDSWLLAEPLRRHGVADADIWAGMARAFEVMEAFVDRHMKDLRSGILPGVPAVLAGLTARGSRLGLLTGNLSGIARSKMRHAGLAAYFPVGGFGEESVDRGDLVPVAMAHAATRFNVPFDAKNVVLIGDTPLDIAAGQAHGTRTCAVATGRFSVAALETAGADLVLDSLADTDRALSALLDLAGPPS